MKKRIALLIVSLFIFINVNIIYAEVDDNRQSFSTLIINGREVEIEKSIFGPGCIQLRAVIQGIGGNLFWNKEENSIMLISGENEYKAEIEPCPCGKDYRIYFNKKNYVTDTYEHIVFNNRDIPECGSAPR